jgi:phosphate transport system substrate-binding protein
MRKGDGSVKRVTGLVLGVAVGLSLCLGGAYEQENKVVFDGSTTVGPIAKGFAEYYMSRHPDVNITVSESGSGNGAKSLINKVCDIADMSRFMKDAEFKAAVDNGVFPVAHVVAMDAVSIIVHPSNSIRALTIDQVRDIYMGKISNWRQLGGADREIVKISRETTSGTYETFDNIVMKKERMARDTEYVASNAAARQRVRDTRSAIGYVGLGFVDRTVKALEINGVYPEVGTVVTGQYPISRPLYMFTNGYPKLGSHVHALVTLHLTEKGQEIVEAKGFVPVTRY